MTRQKAASLAALIWAWSVGPAAIADVNVGVDPTNKCAWAENVGWINFKPTGGGVTTHFDGSSGYLAGYVWGENIGWVKMGDNTGGPYGNNSSTNWGVNFDGSGSLSGYAWGENVGWINFDPTGGGVTIDAATGRFGGYAWGENVGWVRFQGAASNYNVRTAAFDAQAKGTPNWWLARYGVAETDDEGDGEQAWMEYLADTDPTNPVSYFQITAVSNKPIVKVCFMSSSRRYYTLQRRDDLPGSAWTNVATQVRVQGKGGHDCLQDTNSVSKRFYRLRAGTAP